MNSERTFDRLCGDWMELELRTGRAERMGLKSTLDPAVLDKKERLHRALDYLSVRKDRERNRRRVLQFHGECRDGGFCAHGCAWCRPATE